MAVCQAASPFPKRGNSLPKKRERSVQAKEETARPHPFFGVSLRDHFSGLYPACSCTTGLTIRDRAANALVMTDTTSPADISTLSFEAALAELEAIVGKLERGDVPLDESVDLYARGDALRAHCEARLNAAQARIDKISLDAGGKPSGSVPFDAN